jgi:GH18 family chitinase
MEESARYDSTKIQDDFNPSEDILTHTPSKSISELQKRVFGYHPYWSGSKYLNYQWDKLTDICYFSYEVDPNTGEASDLHDFLTSPAIDSALANNVKVHLCITLFSGHSTFFSSSTAQQTLINNCINLLQLRGADGINLDFEALPSSLGDEYTAFTANLDAQMEAALPDAELSMATYAINWSNTYQVTELNNYLDFFMVMTYDYYWNGSSYAGPVGSFYSMTSGFDYSFSRSISYYESEGVPPEKILAGIPYYGRTWKTQGATAPSSTIGNANAKTYSYYRNNSSGNFSIENKKWESNSFAPYYSYQLGNNWYQAFIDDTFSLGKRYDIVQRRNLGGIGIWALGYDNGYTDLWDLIADKFSSSSDTVLMDTIYDSGGPAWNHYNKENYFYQITLPQDETILLRFDDFELEEGYDSLWIYDGDNPNDPLLAALSGNTFPSELQATSNKMLLHFYSDNATVKTGWMAHYLPVSMQTHERNDIDNNFVFPNPSCGQIHSEHFQNADIEIFNSRGIKIRTFSDNPSRHLNLSDIEAGIYILTIRQKGNFLVQKIIIR